MSCYQSRRNRETAGNPVSLFPFLAVLLCTMGALISVLLIIARHAQLSADELVQEMIAESTAASVDPETETSALPHPETLRMGTADADSGTVGKDVSAEGVSVQEKRALLQKKRKALESAHALRLKEEGDLAKFSDEELQQKLEEIRNRTAQEVWRLEELKAARAQVEKEAQTARIALGATQENRNRLMKEVETLLEAFEKMGGTEAERDPEEIRRQIADFEKRVKELQESVEKEENQAKDQNGSYAILPHPGPNGTRRYPMYVECREDGAWLMPENLRLNAIDFEGTLSMENPLEMALSAKRQYLLKNGVFQETSENEQEPYPLLIVRPSGILFLYRVRASLQSWKTEFGYELVEENMPIAYPPNDENLKAEMVRAIHSARVRQRQIAAQAPTLSHYGGGKRGKVAYRATPGGAVPVYLDAESPVGRNLAAGTPNGQSQSGSRMGASDPLANAAEFSEIAETSGAVGTNGTHALPQPAEPSSADASDGVPAETALDPRIALGSAPGQNVTVSAAHDLSQWATVPQSGALQSDALQRDALQRDAANGSGEAAASNSDGRVGGSVQADSDSISVCVASSEGQNWALENYRPTLSSLNRPVPLECHAETLVLKGILDEAPVTISVTTPNQTAKALAAAIQKKIRSWGEPGRGMYWKPILRVRVAENAQETFVMLQDALRFSGLELEKVEDSE